MESRGRDRMDGVRHAVRAVLDAGRADRAVRAEQLEVSLITS